MHLKVFFPFGLRSSPYLLCFYDQVGEPSEDASSETQVGPSTPSRKSAKFFSLTFLSVAVIVPLVSMLAIFLFDKEAFHFFRTLMAK